MHPDIIRAKTMRVQNTVDKQAHQEVRAGRKKSRKMILSGSHFLSHVIVENSGPPKDKKMSAKN